MIRMRFAAAFLSAVSFLLLAPVRGEAETEFEAGAELNSGAIAATGSGKLDASLVRGAFALRGFAESGIAVAEDGLREFDVSLGTNFSAARDSLVTGLSLDFYASEAEGTRTASAGIAAPLALNGWAASLSFVPAARLEFLDEPSATLSAEAAAFLLLADFVWKPGFAVSLETPHAGGRIVEARPSLGVVWYPGLPLSADLSIRWRWIEDEAGVVSEEIPASVSISAVPLSWLSVSLEGEALFDRTGLLSYVLKTGLEWVRERPGKWNPSFPLSLSFDWSEVGDAYGTTLYAGVKLRR